MDRVENSELHPSQDNYRKMTQTPVPRLVLTLAVPTIISMLITSIYNMADTYFVSQPCPTDQRCTQSIILLSVFGEFSA